MEIGVDATCYANPRGYGRFTRQVLPEMVDRAPADTFTCFLDRRAAEHFDLVRPNVRRVVVDLDVSPTLAASADGRRSVSDLLRLTRAVWQQRPAVFFSPSAYTFFPLPPRLRALVTIYDTIVERFPELTLPTPAARVFWRAKVRAALWQASLVLTISEYSAAEITTVLGVPPGRIRIAVPAAADCFRPAEDRATIARTAHRYDIPDGRDWLIYVGGFNPHKHVDLAVRAHARIARRSGPAAPLLLLVGPVDEDVFHGNAAAIRRVVAEEGTDALVRWLGYVPDPELRYLYSGARALLLPSAAEGFGLPAVEAARCGTPVIATTASPLPELLAGGGLFVAPGDLEGLTAAVATLCGDEAAGRAMGAAGLAQSSRLTWTRTADAILAALREIATGRAGAAAARVAS